MLTDSRARQILRNSSRKERINRKRDRTEALFIIHDPLTKLPNIGSSPSIINNYHEDIKNGWPLCPDCNTAKPDSMQHCHKCGRCTFNPRFHCEEATCDAHVNGTTVRCSNGHTVCTADVCT